MSDHDSNTVSSIPPPLVALAGWVIPGAGYWLIGQRTRGTIVLAAIVALYVLGLLIAGVRVIEVPGYDKNGEQIRISGTRLVSPNEGAYDSSGWILTNGGFVSEIANKPWFVGQVLAGPISLASAAASIGLAQRGPDFPRPHAPLETVGTLYTAIAGMLNLMVLIDSAYRAGQPREAQ
jgi:hypothetical protein